METFTPFARPYANDLPSWHHGGHSDRSFHDDSGYASEDPDILPYPSLDSNHIYNDTDQVNHDATRMRRHRAAAFVNAQWSRPAASRACHPFGDPVNDDPRTHGLPQPLAFEQQRNNYESGSRLKPTDFYNRENFGRGPDHKGSWWDFEEKIPPLDFEEHRARVPDTLPPLSNRIESETDRSSASSSSIRHGSPSPEAKQKASQSRGFTISAQTGHRTESSMRSSARRQRQTQSPSHDAQLAAAWQHLYEERTKLEKEKKGLRKKEKYLLHLKKRTHSSPRVQLHGVTGEGSSGSRGPDRTATSDESAR